MTWYQPIYNPINLNPSQPRDFALLVLTSVVGHSAVHCSMQCRSTISLMPPPEAAPSFEVPPAPKRAPASEAAPAQEVATDPGALMAAVDNPDSPPSQLSTSPSTSLPPCRPTAKLGLAAGDFWSGQVKQSSSTASKSDAEALQLSAAEVSFSAVRISARKKSPTDPQTQEIYFYRAIVILH